jgi:hypothetical protein
VQSNEQAMRLMGNYALADLGTTELSDAIVGYVTNKKYAIFVHIGHVQQVTPFEIDKRGFGTQCAWITVDDINKLNVIENAQ